jgi:hypothetical protein
MFSARIQQLSALLGEFIYREINYSVVHSSCGRVTSCGVVQSVSSSIIAQSVTLNASFQIYCNSRIIAIHIAA